MKRGFSEEAIICFLLVPCPQNLLIDRRLIKKVENLTSFQSFLPLSSLLYTWRNLEALG
jgi:hypothetical protein